MIPTADRVIRLTLPHPPSINHYWRRCGSRYFVSKEGQLFQQLVAAEVRSQLGPKRLNLECRIDLRMRYHPKLEDKRTHECDIDNRLKAPIDSLTKAGLWLNDSQIDRLSIHRGEPVRGGRLYVEIREV